MTLGRTVSIRSALFSGLMAASLLFQVGFSHAQPTGGVPVNFETQDDKGNGLTLRAILWTPLGPAKGAVVVVHGSGGWSDHREGHYGRALSAAGFGVLAIDTFGPRAIADTVDDQTKISALQMTRDAFSARRFLLAKGFAANRMAVMGFSKGGTVALLASDRTFLPQEKDRFSVAIPFYPGCLYRPRAPKPASSLFMLLGEKDDYTGVKPCQDLAEDLGKAGGKIVVKVYPGASHGFDGHPGNTTRIYLTFAENYMDCVVHVEENGRLSYLGKEYEYFDAALISAARKTCVKKGAWVWTNHREKDNATRDVIEYLKSSFAD